MIAEILVVIVVVILIIVLAIECRKVYLNVTKLKYFHHVRSLPVFGSAVDFIGKNNEQIFEKFKTEKLSYTWVGPVLLFQVAHPEDFQAILTSEKFLKKAFPYYFLHNRTGLLTAEPHIWKEHRRALNPTLGPKMITRFIPIFNEKSKKMCDLMERELGKNVDMHRIMFKASIDSIMQASFGLNWSVQTQRGDDIHDIILNVMQGLQLRIQRVWLWNPIFQLTSDYVQEMKRFNAFYQFIRSALETKKMDLAQKMVQDEDELAIAKEENCMNFLQKCLLLQMENKFDDENVNEQMDTIFVGSVDTSAVTINGIILMLAIHQKYQDRVVDEMREIFEDVNQPVTNEDLSRMTFTELVIKEGIRHFPIAPYLGRECTEDFKMANGGIIPKGAQCFVNVLKSNKNPKFWGENAHEFYPERFLPENCADWHPYQYIPFSAGPRNCIGMKYAWASLKIALAYLLRRFKFTTELKLHEVIIKPVKKFIEIF